METIKYYYTQPVYEYKGLCVGGIPLSPGNFKRGKRYTFSIVFNDEDHTIKVGMAICNESDNFSKKIGRKISTERARNNPIYVIENFSGRRNDYIDDVMAFLIDTEMQLLRKNYPNFLDGRG